MGDLCYNVPCSYIGYIVVHSYINEKDFVPLS